MAHQYFPKMAAISRVDKSVFTKTSDGNLVLQADIFANMFIKSLKNLEIIFENDDLCKGIYDRFINNQIAVPLQKRQMKGDFGPSSITTFTSGATGVQGPGIIIS
jgi:hypothetical protein